MDIVQGGLPNPEFKIAFIGRDGWGGTRVDGLGGIPKAPFSAFNRQS